MFLKKHPLFNILTPILLWAHACSSDSNLSDNMVKLKTVKDKILNGYDKTIRPTLKGSNKTSIIAQMIPRQILDVDEEQGLFELDSYMYLEWMDPRLAWDKTMFDDYYIQLPPELFWLPDVSIFNSHTKPVDSLKRVILLFVGNGGQVIWIPPIHTSTTCPSLLRVAYPGEVVRCVVRIGTWSHGGDEVDLEHFHEIWSDQFQNIHSRWELLLSDVTVVRNTFSYKGHNDTFFCNEITFPLKRRSSPEIEVTRVPCILVMLLSLSMFWMPPDSSNKLMVGGMSLLSLIVLVIYVACSTKFALGILFAVSFLQSTMYIVVVSILLQVLLILNLCYITGPSRPPAAIMQLLSGTFGKYTCLRSSPSNENAPAGTLHLRQDSQNILKQPTPNEDWILFASGLDRLFFVLMSISMIAIHHV